jgi:hypothetical protein
MTMRWLALICLLASFALPVAAVANTIHVPGDYSTIQAGINAASTGDTVLVADGTYIGFGNRNLNFSGKAITVSSANGPANCIIDCEGFFRGVHFQTSEGPDSIIQGFTIRQGSADTGGGICCEGGASPTITGNVISENSAVSGAGIYCQNSYAVISDNTITGNSAEDDGGGILCSGGAPEITSNEITGNDAYFTGGGIRCGYSSAVITGNTVSGNSVNQSGAGIYCNAGSVTISGNTITDNMSQGRGGGIACNACSPSIEGNTIEENWAGYGGGGIHCEYGGPVVLNTTISGNSAGRYGGGIYAWNNAHPTVSASILTGNRADDGGGGISCSSASMTVSNNLIMGNVAGLGGGIRCSNSTVTVESTTITANTGASPGGAIYCFDSTVDVSNSILWDNRLGEIYVSSGSAPVITWSDISGGYAGTGNIDADPLFLPGPSGALCLRQTAAGQDADSPCLDAADPGSALLPGSTRTDSVQDAGVPDMGFHHPLISDLHICHQPGGFTFTALAGGNPPSDQTLEIWSCGAGPLDWTVSDDADWLTLAPESGSSTGELNPVTVSVDPAGMVSGQYLATVTLSAAGAVNSPQLLNVLLDLTGGEIHVPADYSTIQGAIDAALPGYVVVVADGTYTGSGNRNLDFGGKAITVTSASGPDDCIIDCANMGRGFIFQNSEGPDSVVQGLQIRNGWNNWEGGGGIYCSDASPRITGCIITSCTGPYGGGIFCASSWAVIQDNIITGNLAEGEDTSYGFGAFGGGIVCWGGEPIICGNEITGNIAQSPEYLYEDDFGGGIGCYSTAVIFNNLIRDNTADEGGGGIYAGYDSPAITNNTIIGNWATLAGGGISIEGCSPAITNCILRDNSGVEIEVISGDPLVTYCNVMGGYTGEGNIDSDPLFVDGPLGTHYLSQIAAGQPADSPCVNTGSEPASTLCVAVSGTTVCLDQLTTRSDEATDTGQADMGYHYPVSGTGWQSISVLLSCNPHSGTVPFQTLMGVMLTNLYEGQTRRLAGRIDVTLGSGSSYQNWRAGYTNVGGGRSYITFWSQPIPDLGRVIGQNVFSLAAQDITPAPYNQPPYPPSGDTDTNGCTVTAFAP